MAAQLTDRFSSSSGADTKVQLKEMSKVGATAKLTPVLLMSSRVVYNLISFDRKKYTMGLKCEKYGSTRRWSEVRPC